MTTYPEQPALFEPATEREQYERALGLQLRRLTTWTTLPDERTDWDLETLLNELGATALALRAIRGTEDVPF